MGVFDRLKRVGGYGLSSALPRALGFFLLPVYARLMSEADYGQWSLAELYATLAVTALFLGIPGATTRLAIRNESSRDISKTFLSMGTLSVLLCLAIGGVVALVAPEIGGVSTLLVFGSMASVGLLSLVQICLGLFQAEDRIGPYSLVSALQSLALAAFGVGALSLLSVGILGLVWGRAVAALIVVITGAVLLRRRLSASALDFALMRSALVFSAPLVVHQYSALALNAADRIIIDRLLGVEAVGVYAMAYAVGSAFSVLTSTTSLVVSPRYFRVAADSPAQARWLYEMAVSFLSATGLLTAMVLPIVFRYAFPGKFGEASDLLIWIIGGYMAHAGFSVLSMVALERGATKILASVTVVAALGNIGMNLILIPLWGVSGAAISTLFAFICEMVIVAFALRRWVPMRLHVLPMIALGVVSAGAFFPDLRWGWIPAFIVLVTVVVWRWRSRPIEAT